MDFPESLDLEWVSSVQVPSPPPFDGPEIFGAASRLNHAKRTELLHAWQRQDPDSAVIRYRDALAAAETPGSRSATKQSRRLLDELRPAAEAEWTAARSTWEGRAAQDVRPSQTKPQRIGKW